MGAHPAEGQLAGGGLRQVAGAGEAAGEGEVAAALVEREELAGGGGDGERLGEAERGGGDVEAQGGTRDRVDRGTGAEGGDVADHEGGAIVRHVDRAREGVGAGEDQGAVARVGQVAAGEGEARARGRGDDARDGEGRAGRRREGTAGIAVEGDAAQGGEGQVDRGAEAAVGGQRQGRRRRHGEFGAEG